MIRIVKMFWQPIYVYKSSRISVRASQLVTNRDQEPSNKTRKLGSRTVTNTEILLTDNDISCVTVTNIKTCPVLLLLT